MSRAALPTAGTHIRPRVKVWLEADGEHAFCAGMSRILQAVDETGSIKEAASRVGLSYRHIWSRLKEVEAACGTPLVQSQVGGRDTRRSTLTPAGQVLLQSYLRLKERIQAVSDDCADALQAEWAALQASVPDHPVSQ